MSVRSAVNLAPVDVKHGDTLTFKPNWAYLKGADRGTLQVREAAGLTHSHKLQ